MQRIRRSLIGEALVRNPSEFSIGYFALRDTLSPKLGLLTYNLFELLSHVRRSEFAHPGNLKKIFFLQIFLKLHFRIPFRR